MDLSTPVRRRPLLQLWIVVLLACLTRAAGAAPRDAAAKSKIDVAITKHYLATDFDTAEAVLIGAVSACGGQCGPAVVAKAWMYVGIVRGSGKNNQKGAREAFANALATDPRVALDEALATPQTKKTFVAAQRDRGKAGSAAVEVDPGSEGDAESNALSCTPNVNEVQTRRPVPVSCVTRGEAKKADLHYKSGREPWKSVKMKRKRGVFQATIPCNATQRPGSVRFYVRAKDADGDPAGGFAKKSAPVEISVVKKTEEEPPAFPDKNPPARCSREASASTGKCSSSDECEAGQACVDGACAESQSCEISEDCSNGGKCVEGKCEGGKTKASGPFKENWFGLHLAYDLAIVGGSDVCSLDSQREKGFACFYQGTEEQYRFNSQPDLANKVNTGLAPATYRAMLSFDRVLSANLSAGVRLGYAFGGGPATGKAKDVKFLPYHAEVRVSYWPGAAPFGESGFRPYVGAGAGAAQVDAKLAVKVGDCGGEADGSAPSTPKDKVPRDPAFSSACKAGQLAPGQKAAALDLDVYKKLGQGFVGIHAGIVYALSPDTGIQLNLNIMQMLPTSGQVLEPSLGYVIGL